jgi:hypothetical protein
MLISDGMPRTDSQSLRACDAVNSTPYLFQTLLSLDAFRSDSFSPVHSLPLPLGSHSNSMLTTNDCSQPYVGLSRALQARRILKGTEIVGYGHVLRETGL